jgi:hypothetical protein
VTGAAIEPLHDRIFSDHMVLIVNLNTAQLLGQTLNVAKPKTRLLTLARKKAMRQYCIELDHRLQAQNIYERVGKLHARYKTKTAYTQKMEDQAEILDDYITNCMLTAESTIHSHNLDDFQSGKS